MRSRKTRRDPALMTARVLERLFKICIGEETATEAEVRAIAIWLRRHPLPSQPVLGKKAVAQARAEEPPPADSPWARLIN